MFYYRNNIDKWSPFSRWGPPWNPLKENHWLRVYCFVVRRQTTLSSKSVTITTATTHCIWSQRCPSQSSPSSTLLAGSPTRYAAPHCHLVCPPLWLKWLKNPVQTEKSQQLLDGLPWNFVQSIMGPQRMNPNDFDNPLIFFVSFKQE